ncbi:hypothetical protein BH23BAC1_BH23BAC1_50460 [soil metagenome]
MNNNLSKDYSVVEILIFCTSIQPEDVYKISEKLNNLQGVLNWSVDHEDWEKVLRIESAGISSSQIIDIISQTGIEIKVMPY